MKIEYAGNITEIRAVEDCIRATKRYTEGILSKKHPQQIQGDDFPSRTLHKHYEFYPNVSEISWNMPVNTAIDWLYSDTPCIKLSFRYDYRTNQATVIVADDRDITELNKTVPGFDIAIQAVGKQIVISSVEPVTIQRSVNA
jgi:hypothetical protein